MTRVGNADVVLVAIGIVALVVTAVGFQGPVRAVVALAALLLLPGWVIVRHLRVEDTVTRFVLATVISAAVVTLVSLVMVWTRFWYPSAAGIVVTAASTAWIAFGLYRASTEGKPHA